MTDQIPADKVRETIAAMRAAMRRDTPAYSDEACLSDMARYVRDLEALLPDPPRPTLADMSMEAREECRWMRANVAGNSTRYVIADPRDDDNDAAILVSEDGELEWVFPEYVVPRPDLPRMPWTDNEKVAPAPAPALPEGWRLADHKDLGRGIVTNTTPNRNGHVYFVLPDDEDHRGYGEGWCAPDALTYLDQDTDQPRR